MVSRISAINSRNLRVPHLNDDYIIIYPFVRPAISLGKPWHCVEGGCIFKFTFDGIGKSVPARTMVVDPKESQQVKPTIKIIIVP